MSLPADQEDRYEDVRERLVETTVTEENHISDIVAMFMLKRWRPEYRDSYRPSSPAW